MVKSPIETRRALTRETAAGVAGGIVLTLMMTLMSAASGKDVWYGVKGAAAPFFGDRAMQPGFDGLPVLIGLICHLAFTICNGNAPLESTQSRPPEAATTSSPTRL